MRKSRFEEYLARFNAEDETAFDEFLMPDVRVLNGTLELPGVENMKAHYRDKVWPFFKENLNLKRFVSSDTVVAVDLWTNFLAHTEAPATIFGRISRGDRFDYRGLIMYDVVDGRFSTITVAYNSFKSTTADGTIKELGIVH